MVQILKQAPNINLDWISEKNETRWVFPGFPQCLSIHLPSLSPHVHMFIPREFILVKLYVSLGKNYKINLEFNSLFLY